MLDVSSPARKAARWPLAFGTADAMALDGGLSVSPYGSTLADLDVDFFDAQRPFLLTRLLAGRLRRGDGSPVREEEIWNWTLTQRLQALLAVVLASCGQSLSTRASCSHAVCAASMELELDLLLFCQSNAQASFLCTPEQDVAVTLRLPTGNDQRRWLEENEGEVDALVMARTLVVGINGVAPATDWRMPRAWLATIAVALGEHDPFTVFTVETRCPHCSQAVSVALDFEGLLLSLLAGKQARILQQIHRIASVYHWSESDILSLSDWRRDYYLERINEGSFP
jgi:hypothetical protein